MSGPTMSNLLREDHPASVKSLHIPRFVSGLEGLEAKAGFREPANDESSSDIEQESDAIELSLDDLVRSIHERGFAVTLTPLPPS